MNAIAEYLLSVTGASIISAIVLRLVDGKGSAAHVAKLVTGIFVALTVIGPFTQVRLFETIEHLPDISADAQFVIAQGQSASKNALSECISSQVESYILDKATQLGVTLCVEVYMSDDMIPIPVRAHLQGNISPYAKVRLQNILCEDLGIKKENQIWT